MAGVLLAALCVFHIKRTYHGGEADRQARGAEEALFRALLGTTDPQGDIVG